MFKTQHSTNLEQLAETFKALSHPIRLKIAMGLINKDNCNVSTMVEKLGISQPNVSQHLTILKNAGIINGYRNGNSICYRLISSNVKTIIQDILKENNQ